MWGCHYRLPQKAVQSFTHKVRYLNCPVRNLPLLPNQRTSSVTECSPLLSWSASSQLSSPLPPYANNVLLLPSSASYPLLPMLTVFSMTAYFNNLLLTASLHFAASIASSLSQQPRFTGARSLASSCYYSFGGCNPLIMGRPPSSSVVPKLHNRRSSARRLL